MVMEILEQKNSKSDEEPEEDDASSEEEKKPAKGRGRKRANDSDDVSVG